MTSKILSTEEYLKRIAKLNPRRHYPVMYNSVVDGYLTDPALMCVPIDDHIVHRGDGIFEAVRLVGAKYYLLREHLERLARSADMVALKLPMSLEKIGEIARELHEISKLERGILRLYVSRGPGDFTPNPYSTIGSQLYVVLTESAPPAEEKYANGVSICFSTVAVKPGFFSQVKSCNYLPNVLTKKESIDRGFDFAINLTPDGAVAEGPTENILVWTSGGDLVAPKFDYTLRGTTLVRVLDLARSAKSDLLRSLSGHGQTLGEIRNGELHKDELFAAREIMVVGTTQEVMPVTRIENRPVADGKVGSLAPRLRELLQADMRT